MMKRDKSFLKVARYKSITSMKKGKQINWFIIISLGGHKHLREIFRKRKMQDKRIIISTHVHVDGISNDRGKSGVAAGSGVEHYVVVVSDWKPLTIVTERSILDVAACLQSVTGYLRVALVFMWHSALRKRFNCYFLGLFLLVLTKFSFWRGEWALGYHYLKFRHFLNIFLFTKILSFKSYGNSWGNSYIPSS